MTTTETTNRRYKQGSETARGFATLPPERRRELASMGGTKAQALKTGHRFTHDEAVAAGKIGGAKSRKRGPNKNYKPQGANNGSL